MNTFYVGIDIAKLTFVAAIKISDKYKVKSFSNSNDGFKKLTEWLETFSDGNFHFCMESTGKYGNALALFLFKRNAIISIVNPARIKYFAKSQLVRNKTDSLDAKIIHEYCVIFTPPAWKPLPVEIQELQTLVKRLDTLNMLVLQEQNRLENIDDITNKSIDDHINYLKNDVTFIEKMIDEHINNHSSLHENSKLLRSIPGIGEKTTSKTLAFLSHISDFDSARKVAAFIGLNPQHAQSGTSLNYSHISKTGDAKLRKMFYMPALVAIQCEPSIRAFYEKLLSKGKAKKVAICAVMRKLVHIIYGVLKSQKPFDPQLIAVH